MINSILWNIYFSSISVYTVDLILFVFSLRRKKTEIQKKLLLINDLSKHIRWLWINILFHQFFKLYLFGMYWLCFFFNVVNCWFWFKEINHPTLFNNQNAYIKFRTSFKFKRILKFFEWLKWIFKLNIIITKQNKNYPKNVFRKDAIKLLA